MKYKFKVGDNVSLKKGLTSYKRYGHLTFFVGGMGFTGRRIISKRVYHQDSNSYYIENWWYTEDMLEKVEDKKLKFNENQYTKGLTKEMVKQVEGIVFSIVKKQCTKR